MRERLDSLNSGRITLNWKFCVSVITPPRPETCNAQAGVSLATRLETLFTSNEFFRGYHWVKLYDRSTIPVPPQCQAPGFDKLISDLAELKVSTVNRAREFKRKSPDDKQGREGYNAAAAAVAASISLYSTALTRNASLDTQLEKQKRLAAAEQVNRFD